MAKDIKVKGHRELKANFKSIKQVADDIHDSTVPLTDLYGEDFMKQYTNFDSIEEMFTAAGFNVTSNDDLQNVPNEAIDTFVQSNTKFESWEEMTHEAAVELSLKQFGF